MSVETTVLPPRYENCERIGRGGMGDIYLAHDRQLARKVAIKVLAERFSSDADVRARFKREALTAARLSGNPHIVTIFDVGEWDDRPHIVMEYLSRGSLADRNRSGRVQTADALDWLDQAADALDAAHEASIVHRDVKPANLLFDARDELNVADFGIARVLDQTTAGVTAPGTIMGTSGYISPEQANGEPATAASDIYSLGAVAYELLAGVRPFQRRSATAEAAAHLHEPVPRASERQPELATEVDDVFEHVLAKDPAHRHATAGEFVADLRAAVEAGEPVTRLVAPAAPPVPPVEAAPPADAPRRRSRLLPLLAALLLVGAGALAAVLLTRGGDQKQAEVTRTIRSVSTMRVTAAGTTVVQPTTVNRTITTPAAPPSAPASPPAAPASPPPAAAPPSPSPPSAARPSTAQASLLTDQAKAANEAGDYATGVRLGQQSLRGLRGTGIPYEAYADYNYAVSLIGVGRCAEAIPYLDRSEQIQGRRSAIDAARTRAEQCGGSTSSSAGKGKGKAKGRGKLKPHGSD